MFFAQSHDFSYRKKKKNPTRELMKWYKPLQQWHRNFVTWRLVSTSEFVPRRGKIIFLMHENIFRGAKFFLKSWKNLIWSGSLWITSFAFAAKPDPCCHYCSLLHNWFVPAIFAWIWINFPSLNTYNTKLLLLDTFDFS